VAKLPRDVEQILSLGNQLRSPRVAECMDREVPDAPHITPVLYGLERLAEAFGESA